MVFQLRGPTVHVYGGLLILLVDVVRINFVCVCVSLSLSLSLSPPFLSLGLVAVTIAYGSWSQATKYCALISKFTWLSSCNYQVCVFILLTMPPLYVHMYGCATVMSGADPGGGVMGGR